MDVNRRPMALVAKSSRHRMCLNVSMRLPEGGLGILTDFIQCFQ